MRDGYYHTGDVAARDADGYITYVGRTDDVFKASDYRISPFELESVLIEHDARGRGGRGAEPRPAAAGGAEGLRRAAPAAASRTATRALAILALLRATQLAPYKRIRRLEFAELPKTISGKIRRVELRARDRPACGGDGPVSGEFSDADFPELRE